jgi:hypothetical protein
MALDIGANSVIRVDGQVNFSDDDWCIGFWLRIADLSGAGYRALAATSSSSYGFNMFVPEEDLGYTGWLIIGIESIGGRVDLIGYPGSLSQGKLIVIQRKGSLFELWQSSLSGVTRVAYDYSGGFGGFNLDNFTFFNDVIARLFIGQFSLSENQIGALGRGLPITTFDKNLLTYAPLISREEKDAVTGRALSYGSTPANAAVVEDFPLIGLSPALAAGPEVGGGGNAISPLASYYNRRHL